MRSLLISLSVALPVLAAGFAVVVQRHRRIRTAISVTALGANVAIAALLLVSVDLFDVAVAYVGGWGPRLGIVLVADRLSALLLLVSSAVLFAVLCYAIGQLGERDDPEGAIFYPVYLTLAAGVSLAFVSGDLFNLFVAFEVMLASSYVLIMLPPDAPRVRSGMTYMVVSLTSSILFLTAVALVYASTGTVNLALLAERIPQLPNGLVATLGVLLIIVFGIKAAVVPMHFWLPDSYPTALSMVTAVFAALLTKVAVYTLIRIQTSLFTREGPSLLLIMLALVTMSVGALAALRQDDLNRLLSFLLVSHIGYMVVGLALSSSAGLRGAILYLVHHIVIQATLFQLSGLVQDVTGGASLGKTTGVVHIAPAVGIGFFVVAMSLSGVPPLSGFVAKLALIQAALSLSRGVGYVVATAIVGASLLTLGVMVRAWTTCSGELRGLTSTSMRWTIGQRRKGPPRDVRRGSVEPW